MASREETLLFIVDVQVRNANAVRALDAELDEAARNRIARLTTLNDIVNRGEAGNGAAAMSGGGPIVVEHRGSNTPTSGGGGGIDQSVVGVRGRQNPGGRTNPIAFVEESGQAGGLGSLAAPGTSGGDSSSGNGPNVAANAPTPPAPSPVVGPADRSWLADAAQQVASKVVQPEDDRVIAAIEAASSSNRNARLNPLLTASDAVRAAQATPGVSDAASLLQRRRGAASGATPADLVAAAQGVQSASQPSQQGLASQLANMLASRVPAPRNLSSGQAAGRLGASRSQVREMASTGQIPGARKENGEWVIPENAIEDLLAAGGGAGGGGGGVPPTARGGSGGGGDFGAGGGGRRGARTFRTIFGGRRTEEDGGKALSFGNLFKGDQGRGGAFGLPGFGSIGSLAGLGLEHWILSALGIGASATAAVGGAGLLGTASLTQSAVGGGADALINKATGSQIKATTQDFYALQTAIAEYGKGSKQAVAAQNLLNYSIAQMGGGAAQQAELQVYKNVKALKELFGEDSNAARAESAQGMDQIVKLATSYVPAVTAAAQRNLAVINTGLKPLFSWLEGPQGMGIFNSLENAFARDLPTSIHAFDMGIEDFLRLMQATSQYTGGLSQTLDTLFTDKNRESAAQYDAEVQKLVNDLHLWENLLKVLGQDVRDVFKQDAGTANSIVVELTQMLEKLHDWETSTTGQDQLKNIFAVHKQEILQLLNLVGRLGSIYGNFYMDVAPPLVKALTDIAGAIDKVLTAVEKLPGGADLLGLTLVLGKLGALGPALKATGGALGLIDRGLAGGTLGKATLGAAGVGAARTGAGAAEEGAAGAGGVGLLSKLLSRIGGSAPGKMIAGGVETGALGAAGAAEGAGLGGLAEAVAGAGAAIAPVAAGLLPLLAAAGGVAGLVELFKAFSGSGDYGNKVANNVAHSLGIKPSQTGNLASDLNQRPSTPGAAEAARVGVAAPQTTAQFTKAGRDAITAFVNAVQSAKFPSTLLVLKDMQGELDQLPPQARDSAARTMLEYAQTLQSQGKLPQGAVRNLIQVLEGQFPGLRNYLHTQGLGMASDFATTMRMSKAISNTQGVVATLKQEFGNVFDNAKLTSGNLLSSVTSDYSELRDNMGSLTKAGRVEAEQQMGILRQTATEDATATEQNVSNKMLMLKNSIVGGSASAVASATGSFQAFSSNIATAMASGALATGKGTQLIAEALNIELKSFGAKPIPAVALKSLSAKQLLGEENFITSGTAGSVGTGTGHRATGGMMVNHPTYVVGEEAPAHPEYVVATNPAYRERNLGLWARAGKDLGVPGFAQGGVLSYGQLEGLWDKAGGQKSMAPLMAAIAMAESSGNPNSTSSYNDAGSFAKGLWQIEVPMNAGDIPGGTANVYNPLDNAIGAVHILASQGLDAWETYTNGAYRQYLQGNVPPDLAAVAGGAGAAGAAAALAQLTSPKVTGTGAIADMVRGALALATKSANSFLSSQAATSGGAAGGSGGALPTGPLPSGGGFTPSQLELFDGLEVAKWIVPELLWARQHGWAGSVTSGWRSPSQVVHGTFATAPQGQSEHQYDIYPGGAVDVSDYEQFASIIRGYPGPDRLIQLGIDPLHFSGTGHATGGLLGGAQPSIASLAQLAKKATSKPGKPTPEEQAFIASNKNKAGKKPAKPTKLRGVSAGSGMAVPPSGVAAGSGFAGSTDGIIGLGGPFPFDVRDFAALNGPIGTILGLDGTAAGSGSTGGDAQTLSNLVSWYSNVWGSSLYPTPNFGSWGTPSDFVISSTDSAGNTTYSISPNIDQVSSELGQIIGWQGGVVSDLQQALGLSQEMSAPSGPIEGAIKRRTAEVKKIKQRIENNVKHIKKLQKDIAEYQKQISNEQANIKREKAKSQPYPHPKNAAQRAANQRFEQQRNGSIATSNGAISGLRQQIKSAQGQIAPREAENQLLGGSKTGVGTGGELGQIAGQLGTGATGTSAVGVAEGTGSAATGLYGLESTVQGWAQGLGGVGGDVATQMLQLQEYQAALAALLPGANSALAADLASATTAASTASTSPITGEVGFTFQGQEQIASLMDSATQAYKTISSLPAYGGSFWLGGTIPGAIGEPRMIEAHGGEVVTNPHLPGASNASQPLTAAITQLTGALQEHQDSVRQNTAAMCANTSAVSSSSTTGAQVRYSGAYDPMTSSDSLTNVGVGG